MSTPPEEPRPATPDGRFDVFVFCALEDLDWTEGFLLSGLRLAGVRCLEESQFRLGQPTVSQFVDAVERSDRVVLVITPAFLTDPRVEFVKLLASHYGAEHSTWPVVPVLLKPVAKLPLDLSLLTSLDMTEQQHWETRLAHLVSDLNRELPADGEPPDCPYPGMAPFASSGFAFHGRDAEIEEAIGQIRSHPVLAVIGPSGSGKSSLLAAGVQPQLERLGFDVVSFRPGHAAAAALGRALQDVTTNPPRPTVLIVDQFEELFTLSGGSELVSRVDSFVTGLRDAWTSGLAGCVIALRADYYPQLMTCPLWPDVRDHRFELLPLAGDQLREAIRSPASAVGVYVESALVEAVVRDATGAPGSLPLIQETLVLLWGRLTRRFLPMSAYDALVLPGRAYGEPPRTGLQVALARHANATMAKLSDADQATARRIFVRLVQLMDGREDVRRQQSRRDLESADSTESVGPVLEHLIASRLLTSSADVGTVGSGETLIDLSHEAIITGWPELRAWIAARRTAERFRRRLEADADKWVEFGRSSGGLMDEFELAQARAWLDGPDAGALGVSASLDDFVKKSETALSTARHRSARLNRLFRVLTGALAALLVAVLVVAVIAVQQRNEAENGRVTAKAGELGLIAETLPPEQLDRALLIAQAGLSMRRTTQTVGGALAALSTNPRVERVLHAPAAQIAVAVAADGRTAVTGGTDGVIHAWDLVAGRDRALATVGGEVRSVALSPDGSTVLATSSAGDVGQWEIATGRRVAEAALAQATSTAHQGSVRASAYNRDGTLMATAGQDGKVIVRAARSGRVVHVFTGYRDWLNAVVFTPDGKTLVAAGGRTEGRSVDRRILLWDLPTGRLRAQLPGHDDAVRALAVSADGAVLASAGAEGTIKTWSLPQGRLARQIGAGKERVLSIAFSPDGRLLASAGRDHTVRVWDPSTGVAALAPLLGHEAATRGVAFTDERTLLSVGNDHRLCLWNVGTQLTARLARPLDGHSERTRALAVDPTGALVATGDDSGRVVLRRAADGSPTGVSVNAGAPVSDLALGQGSSLVTVTYAGEMRVWDSATGAPRTAAVDLGEGSPVVAISPDGRRIATGGDRNLVRLWDAQLHETATLEGHRNWIRDLAFRTQDGALVSVGADGLVFLWTDLATTPVRTAVNKATSRFESVAISPDGQTIATGNTEGQVVLWDASESEAEQPNRPTLAGHDGVVTGIAYDPWGPWMLTTDAGGTVRLWAAGSGFEPVGVLGRLGEFSGIVTVAGNGAVTVGAGGPARWMLDEADWRRVSCVTAGRELTVDEARRYGLAEPPPVCDGGGDGH
ncbi:MAG: TIR domain-containing protein [Humibacillus sp.]|nr:TIR domain-containing protein [Humibacillus sp.]MDN5779231.1 TIR domain-containing protein [Humibacillus sp.]